MIIHICPPVPLLLRKWSVLWQGVNWLGPAVCVCVCVHRCVSVPPHKMFAYVYVSMLTAWAVSESLSAAQHMWLSTSLSGSLPLFLTCALRLPIPAQPCSALLGPVHRRQGPIKEPAIYCSWRECIRLYGAIFLYLNINLIPLCWIFDVFSMSWFIYPHRIKF